MKTYNYEITRWNDNGSGWITIHYIDENGECQEWITDMCDYWCNKIEAGYDMDYIKVVDNDGCESWEVIWKK